MDFSDRAWDLFLYLAWAFLAPGWEVNYTNPGNSPSLCLCLCTSVQVCDLQGFKCWCIAAMRQMIQPKVMQKKELENLTRRLNTYPQKLGGRNNYPQTTDMQLWYLKQRWRSGLMFSDLDGLNFSLGWIMTTRTNWEWKPSTPTPSPDTENPKLHLSVLINMTLSYTSVFISMTLFFQESPPPGKWLDWALQDIPKDSSTLQWKASPKICTQRFFQCLASKSWPCHLLLTLVLQFLSNSSQAPHF